ncbi:MAG: cytochrome c biogenesis protein CcsA [Armatimonadetes bacterium]|nr:cytochrome c biogenesis protein CcsA [Armatimonadota bacterium]
MILSHALFDLSFFVYLVASLFYQGSLFLKNKIFRAYAPLVAGLALTIHAAAIVSHAFQTGRPPFASLFDSISLFAWAILLLYLFLETRWRLQAVGAFALPIGALAILYASSMPLEAKPLEPDLRSYWVVAHVLTSILSYGAFTLAFCCAVIYLWQERLLKTKRLTGLFTKLPPLERMDTLTYWLVAFGFALLTVGLLTGAIWAHMQWSSQWVSDPKVVVSCITWLIYAVYLGVRASTGWSGRRMTYLLMTGFVAMLLNYFAVETLLPGAHSLYRT